MPFRATGHLWQWSIEWNRMQCSPKACIHEEVSAKITITSCFAPHHPNQCPLHLLPGCYRDGRLCWRSRHQRLRLTHTQAEGQSLESGRGFIRLLGSSQTPLRGLMRRRASSKLYPWKLQVLRSLRALWWHFKGVLGASDTHIHC